MRTLGWTQRRFKQNNDERSRNVSTNAGIFSSCFSALWEFDEQQHYPDAKNTSARFRQPRVCPISFEAHGEEDVNKEETVKMIPELFHGFLEIGTLGSVSINTEDIITLKAEMPFEIATEKETSAAENELQYLNKVHDDTTENKNMTVYPLKEYSELPAIKEEENEQNTTPDKPFKKNATSYKRSGKLDKRVKGEILALHFIKKILKALDFTSICSPTSAGGNDIFSDLTEKKPKLKKISPEAVALDHVTKSNNYDVKKTCRDADSGKEMTLVDEYKSQPPGKKEHWIKTKDYYVLEF